MKRLLPILTLALLGAAATASAENFYYDYYKDPDVSTVGEGKDTLDGWWYDKYYTDSVSYKDFEVARNSNWNAAEINNSNFYRIHVVGNDVDLYLTDFVDTVLDETNSNALYNHIAEYGYRQLSLVDGKYVATGDTTVKQLSVTEAGDPIITSVDELGVSESSEAPTIDTINNEGRTIERYKYHLGTFSDGDIIELYMKDLDGGEAYSYSSFNDVNPDNTRVGALGGFGDGGYRVNLQTDEMLHDYYFQDEKLEEQGLHGFTGDDAEAKRVAASSKAMPLSALDPSGSRVYFGIIASTAEIGGGGGDGNGGSGNGTFGQPLPGGLQIALIAGLFGLGFWFIRRRKNSVA
jgi:hypothetical protein